MSMAKKSAQEKIVNPPKNVLYVVLHGLICLIDDNRDSFTAALVDMGNDHAYLCGDFLYEDEIESAAELKLNGVDERQTKSKENQLDPKSNAVVKIKYSSNEDNYYHSLLCLPRPAKIHYYIQGKLVKDSLKDSKNELQEPKPEKISGIRVFEYTFADYRGVSVTTKSGDIFWKCPPPTPVVKNSKSLHVAVLHVFNEPPDKLSNAGKHNKDEFNFTLAYLGAQLRLATPAAELLPNDPPPHGMRPEELYALDMRRP